MNNSALSFHDVPRQRAGWSRTGSIAFVVALHVAAIWALANGLIEKFSVIPPTKTTVQVIDTKIPPPTPLPPVKPIMTHVPTPTTVPEPFIKIAPDDSSGGIQTTTVQLPRTTTVPDTPASAVAATHSTPLYPALARRLGQQGTVTLALTIGADGSVSDAQVATSSGVAELDQAAVAWVKAHWRYKPASRAGTPVPSSARAAVKFDLKEAG